MILGLSSFTYGWAVGFPGSYPPRPLDEDKLVERTVNASLNCLQIGDNLPLHSFSKERLGALKALVTKKNIRLEMGARGLSASTLQQSLTIASYLESPLIRFIIDDSGYEPDAVEIIAIISDFLPELHRLNITLGLENHDRFKAAQLATIIESIADDHVGICLDCVNSIGACESLEHVTRVLGPYAVNLHIKDFVIQRLPHRMGFSVTGAPLGRGMLKLEDLLDRLSTRCVSAVLEQWVPPEKTIAETIAKENQWADEGLQYLTTLQHFKKYQTLI